MTAEKKVPGYMKFVLGGSSGMIAICFVQPLDLIKNRLQLAKDPSLSSTTIVLNVIKKEGITKLYSGLSAGLLRQATYTTTRLGIYTYLFEQVSTKGKPPGFLTMATMGIVAGGIGAFMWTPTEVALIRMTSDGSLPPDQRRNYKNVFHAIQRIGKEEGIKGLWSGSTATVGRAMVVNAAQLGSYSQAKKLLLYTGLFHDNFFLYFSSSMVSGFITSAASLPVDIAKTRIQNMKIIDGKPEYTGMIDAQRKIIKNEGIFALWRGFLPYYFRIGPHTVITFIVLEQLTSLYRKIVLGETEKGTSSL